MVITEFMEQQKIQHHYNKNYRNAEWWGQLGSNQRPSGYEPPALTPELCPLTYILSRNIDLR